jgi:hypothetical protein
MVIASARFTSRASGRATKRARLSDLAPFLGAFAVFFLSQVALEAFHRDLVFEDATLMVFQTTASLNRYLVAITSVILVLLSLTAIVIAATVIARNFDRAQHLRIGRLVVPAHWCLLALIAVFAVAAGVGLKGELDVSTRLGRIADESIVALTLGRQMVTDSYSLADLLHWKNLVDNVTCILGAVLVAIAACTIPIGLRSRLVPVVEKLTRWRIIKRQMAYLNLLVVAASSLLAAGVVDICAWTQWPTPFLEGNLSPVEIAAFTENAEGLVIYNAVMFTLILAAIFVPPSTYLSAIVEREKIKCTSCTDKRVAPFAENTRVSFTPKGNTRSLLAILSQMLAGPLPIFLDSLF